MSMTVNPLRGKERGRMHFSIDMEVLTDYKISPPVSAKALAFAGLLSEL
jgi:hypothetical protein